jgi:hypothetical protein
VHSAYLAPCGGALHVSPTSDRKHTRQRPSRQIVTPGFLFRHSDDFWRVFTVIHRFTIRNRIESWIDNTLNGELGMEWNEDV